MHCTHAYPNQAACLTLFQRPKPLVPWNFPHPRSQSYGRALDLAPGRLYCRLQAAALSYQMGDMPAALAQYRTALAAPPAAAAAAVPGGGGVPAPADHPAALLGCGEVLLAQVGGGAGAAVSGVCVGEGGRRVRARPREGGGLPCGYTMVSAKGLPVAQAALAARA